MKCEKCGRQTCIIYVTASGRHCEVCEDAERRGSWGKIEERNRRWLDGTQEEVDD